MAPSHSPLSAEDAIRRSRRLIEETRIQVNIARRLREEAHDIKQQIEDFREMSFEAKLKGLVYGQSEQ